MQTIVYFILADKTWGWLSPPAELNGAICQDVDGHVGRRQNGILDDRPLLDERRVRKPEFSVVVDSVQEDSGPTFVNEPRVEPLLPEQQIDFRFLKCFFFGCCKNARSHFTHYTMIRLNANDFQFIIFLHFYLSAPKPKKFRMAGSLKITLVVAGIKLEISQSVSL